MDNILSNKINEYFKRNTFANDKEYRDIWYMLPSPLVGNRLFDINPILSKEWHPTKNGNLTPEDVSIGSEKKVWWICKRGHEWQAIIYSRNNGVGCPYCSGQAVCTDNCLETVNPTLAKEWHPTKNENLTPEDVTDGSHKKVWWKCNRGHEWKSTINSRNKGNGCPFCSGRLATKDNCLETVNHILAKQWHPTKNGNLTPKNVTAGTNNKVWWVCDRGHEWQAIIASRSNGLGCPYCSRKAVCTDNCLQTVKPTLAEEWHPTKNGNLTPADITPGSDKKVWWVCKRGHEWQAHIYSRSKGSGCPFCSGNVACKDNCLQTVNPTLAREWHSHKNENLTPEDVKAGSNKKVWWICKRGHEWQASIANRSNGLGCPYCSGRLVTKDNCLETVNPILAKQWHPTKNGNLTPKNVTGGTHKKAWWICKRGHEWQATIISRNNRGRGCPYCSSNAICKDNCLQTVNPTLAREWNSSKNGNMTPRDVQPYSNKKVWWICKSGHEWQARLYSRSKGSGCPQCAHNHKHFDSE